ncbi:MAG: DUF924 family protein [Armatimonadota bacterium]
MCDLSDQDQARIESILDYWFGPQDRWSDSDFIMERMKTLWFAEDPAVDEEIADRFGDDYTLAVSGAYDHWRTTVSGRLALIILLDQFSRNMFRDSAKAFAQDTVGRELTLEGLRLGIDGQLAPVERLFFYLPLEHSELLEDQEESVRRFEQLHREAPTDAQAYTGVALDYAIRHKVVIEQFGRFPHRNELLGRTSTEEESAFLREHGAGF